jgi:hypothetical protein
MPKRTCDSCGIEKDIDGGKTCEKGHFICKSCIWEGTGGGFFGDGKKYCPLCRNKLR